MRLLLFLFSVSLAFAQLDSNSVTVTASRTSSVQPDQVVFGITVSSGLDVNLTDVVAAVQSAGLTLSNFTGVNQSYMSSGRQTTPALFWSFALPVSLDKMKDTVATLNNLMQNIAKDNSGLSLSFNVQGTQASLPLAQSQTCPIADLLSDARTKAQKLAGGAGMTAGSILAMSGFTSSTLASSAVYVASYLYNPTANCSITVKFALK